MVRLSTRVHREGARGQATTGGIMSSQSLWIVAQSVRQNDAINIVVMLIEIGLLVLIIAGMWKVFAKAGYPGWAAIIPIYNVYILCKVAGRPGWWLILFLIPFVNWIIMIVIGIDIARNFGKSAGFGVGLGL